MSRKRGEPVSINEKYKMDADQPVWPTSVAAIGTRKPSRQKNIISDKAIKLPRR